MAPSRDVPLSKSKLNAYHQCRKRLWLEVHHPELRVDSAASRMAFSIGHTVGELAQREHPDGILIGPADPTAPIDWQQAFADTTEALRLSPRRPIFEATCRHDGVLVRADVLVPRGTGWHMAEVKSSTKLKRYYAPDVAVQTWVMRNAGIDIASVELRHIDRRFVYPGGSDYAGLFCAADVQDEVEALQAEVPRWVADARAVAASGEPQVAMGRHCNEPFACPFEGYCTGLAGPQPEYPVTILPGKAGKALARQLAAEGLRDLRDVPPGRVDDPLFATMVEATRAGTQRLDLDGARAWFDALGYPRFYFDFETINFAVPPWVGTRPYEQVPFQWSCHVERAPGVFEHREFLDLSGDDPSRECAAAMIEALQTDGAIVAHHASFETGVIHDLGKRHPDLEPALTAIRRRFADLEDVVRERYYHPDMRGSFSIKKVLPTIAPDLGYDHLDEVAGGTAAQLAYVEGIASATPAERREELRRRLLTYCTLDTWAMVVIAWHLEGRGRPTTPPG